MHEFQQFTIKSPLINSCINW